MLPKNISSDVSLDYVEVEDIVDRKVDQLSHQHLSHNFLEPVKGTAMQIEKALINDHSHASKVS